MNTQHDQDSYLTKFGYIIHLDFYFSFIKHYSLQGSVLIIRTETQSYINATIKTCI